MQTTIKNKAAGLVELTVELGRSELESYLRGVENEFRGAVDIKGFRRGKAPDDVLKKHLDSEKVREIALQEAISASLAEAIREKDLDVASSTDLLVKENSANRLIYSVKLTVFPVVAVPNLGTFQIKRKTITVQEKEVVEALDVIRNMRAKFSDKDGAAAVGDRVEIDFQARLNGELIEGGESKSHPLIIGGKNFMPGFEEQIVGMSKDQLREFALDVPKDYAHKAIAGKKLDFSVKANLVQTVNLPELNDEFAQSLGQFKNMEQLRQNVREGLQKEKENKETEQSRIKALETIATATKIEVPDFMVQMQLDSMLTDFDRDLHEKGMELGLYLARLGKTQDELRKDWHKEAVKQASFALILRAVARQNDISVAPQEVEDALNQTVQMAISRGQADPANIDVQALRTRIAERMVNEKTLEFIEKTCVSV